MTHAPDAGKQRSAELLRFALERAKALSSSSIAERSETWGYEAASVGDVSTLAALTLLLDDCLGDRVVSYR